jgi:hypothetical protein
MLLNCSYNTLTCSALKSSLVDRDLLLEATQNAQREQLAATETALAVARTRAEAADDMTRTQQLKLSHVQAANRTLEESLQIMSMQYRT